MRQHVAHSASLTAKILTLLSFFQHTPSTKILHLKDIFQSAFTSLISVSRVEKRKLTFTVHFFVPDMTQVLYMFYFMQFTQLQKIITVNIYSAYHVPETTVNTSSILVAQC